MRPVLPAYLPETSLTAVVHELFFRAPLIIRSARAAHRQTPPVMRYVPRSWFRVRPSDYSAVPHGRSADFQAVYALPPRHEVAPRAALLIRECLQLALLRIQKLSQT